MSGAVEGNQPGAVIRAKIESLRDGEWLGAEDIRSLRAAVGELEARAERAQKECNICGKEWPHHYEACAYVGNVRDLKAAEARVAELVAQLQTLYDAGITIMVSSTNRQEDWDAFSDALTKSFEMLAAVGGEHPK